MLREHPVSRLSFLSLAAVSVLGIIFLTGCPLLAPLPQTPRDQPADDEDPTEPPARTTPADDRPVTPPDIDDTGDGGAADDGGSGGGGGTSGGTTGSTATFSIRISGPLNPLTRRARKDADVDGEVVTDTVQFELRLRNADDVAGTFIVLARDDDENGEPDDDPVTARTEVSVPIGVNHTLTYETNALEVQGLLEPDDLGKFVIGLLVVMNSGQENLYYAPGTITIDNREPVVEWVSPKQDDLVTPMPWEVRLNTDDNGRHTVQVLLDDDTTADNGFAGILVNETEFGAGVWEHTFTEPLDDFASAVYYYYVIVSDGIDPPVALYASATPGVAGGEYKLSITRRLVGEYDLNRLDPESDVYDNTAAESRGTILQGFNFNDLAGSAMIGVPDLDLDGLDELVIVSRFGKPRIVSEQGVGWGEAYLVLGGAGRLREPKHLNAVGNLGSSGIPGLVFMGIRCPRTTTWTEGISDVTVVPDMDGDELPELVFSFPRTESINLDANPWQAPDLGPYDAEMGSLEYDPSLDEVDTVDVSAAGVQAALETAGYQIDFDLTDFTRASVEVEVNGATWLKNRTHFTRGGIVIVSSSNSMFDSPTTLTLKGDRIIDLHEVGQMFSDHRRDEFVPIIELSDVIAASADCDGTDTDYNDVLVFWDVIMAGQGPVGFDNRFTEPRFWDPLNPPLANMIPTFISLITIAIEYLAIDIDPCDGNSYVLWNEWYPFSDCQWLDAGAGSMYFKPEDLDGFGLPELDAYGYYIYTGIYGRSGGVTPQTDAIGARVLGQRVNTRFGTTVSADDTWLYISSPNRSATEVDVSALGTDDATILEKRDRSGVVYQYRIASAAFHGGPTRSQLWIEPGERPVFDPEADGADPADETTFGTSDMSWPHPDVQRPNMDDWAMPVPHNYIIEDIGSWHGVDVIWEDEWTRLGFADPYPYSVPGYPTDDPPAPRTITYNLSNLANLGGATPLTASVTGGVRPAAACESPVYPPVGIGTSTYYVSHVPQIVGPHAGAEISFVRTVGDVDNDGVGDFAVGSDKVTRNFTGAVGDPVVGAIFIVFGRNTGLEGDYLLEQLTLETTDLNRLAGVVLKGTSENEQLARVFDAAGDFNGDGVDDVIIGNEVGSGGMGEAIILLGSTSLQSPGGGWTVDQAVAAGVAIRFVGENVNDLAGANVAGAGDVDNDGYDDVLIAAPGAAGGKGAVYLVYGSNSFSTGSDQSLSLIGTFDLPGVRFLGRNAGDSLGGGVLAYGDGVAGNPNRDVFLNPDNTPVQVFSDGVVSIGDLDGDGYGDYAISAMLADPLGRRDAGEIYILYGDGD